MRLEQFRYVAEVSKCRSMSKAAKKLFISQPSLSTAISSLENELGFQIFLRSFQGVALTERGEKFLKISNTIVEQLEKIKELSQEESRCLEVNIAAVPAACNSLVIDLITRLRKDAPDIVINIQELRPFKVLTALVDGTADLCIGLYTASTKASILNLTAQHDLQVEEVFQDAMWVYLPSNHPLAERRAVTRQDLARDTPIFFSDYVHMNPRHFYGEEIQSGRNYYTFTDPASMKKAIARGLGYAVLPWQMAIDDIYVASGKIAAVPLAGDENKLTTFLSYRRGAALSPAAEHALSLLRQLYSQLQSRQDKMARPFAEPERPAKGRADTENV